MDLTKLKNYREAFKALGKHESAETASRMVANVEGLGEVINLRGNLIDVLAQDDQEVLIQQILTHRDHQVTLGPIIQMKRSLFDSWVERAIGQTLRDVMDEIAAMEKETGEMEEIGKMERWTPEQTIQRAKEDASRWKELADLAEDATTSDCLQRLLDILDGKPTQEEIEAMHRDAFDPSPRDDEDACASCGQCRDLLEGETVEFEEEDEEDGIDLAGTKKAGQIDPLSSGGPATEPFSGKLG
jgi:hypothetical protein